MMSGINKVILVGHLGKDPDFQILPTNVAVVYFPLITSEKIMKNGTDTEVLQWHNIFMWRKAAYSAANTLSQGQLIYVEGKAITRKFEEGEKNVSKYTTEIIVEKFTVLWRDSDLIIE